MTGLVNVVARSGSISVESSSQTIDGLYIGNGWIAVLPHDTSDAALAQAVMEGLSQTECDIPRVLRPEINAKLKAKLDRLGLRSYAAYMKGARAIMVTEDSPGTLRLTPTRNIGSKGFENLTDRATMAELESGEQEVGRLLRMALDSSM